MKNLIIIGSPRKKGNTCEVAQIISDKLKSFENVETEFLFLSDLNLGFCKGCCACLTSGDENCPNKNDDIKMIEEKLLSSDGVIFLSPVYAMNMTALMKNLMDRLAFTMHRPRFFNQYTMIGSITGAVGLKETIESISQIKYCGFNIVQKFGVVASNPLIKPALDSKTVKKIEKEAEDFYKKLLKKASMKPTFDTIMQYKVQKKTFFKHKDKMPCDYEYFNSKGWFNPKQKYYVNDAKLGFWNNLLSELLVKLI